MSEEQALEQVSFSRAVAGDPLNFRRVWATIVYDVKGCPVQVLVWQDGSWWCMTEKGEHGVFDSTWGNAQHIAQHITVRYGTPTGIDHIDFSL